MAPRQGVVQERRPFRSYTPEDLGNLSDSIAEAGRLLQPWQGEYRVKFPEREVRWLHGSSVPEQADGAILWHGYITDITQREETERATSLGDSEFKAQNRRDGSPTRKSGNPGARWELAKRVTVHGLRRTFNAGT